MRPIKLQSENITLRLSKTRDDTIRANFIKTNALDIRKNGYVMNIYKKYYV